MLVKSEKELMKIIQKMCEESLSPENFEKWEAIKKALFATRKDLKG